MRQNRKAQRGYQRYSSNSKAKVNASSITQRPVAAWPQNHIMLQDRYLFDEVCVSSNTRWTDHSLHRGKLSDHAPAAVQPVYHSTTHVERVQHPDGKPMASICGGKKPRTADVPMGSEAETTHTLPKLKPQRKQVISRCMQARYWRLPKKTCCWRPKTHVAFTIPQKCQRAT